MPYVLYQFKLSSAEAARVTLLHMCLIPFHQCLLARFPVERVWPAMFSHDLTHLLCDSLSVWDADGLCDRTLA
jgi:hypothetical protein